MVSGADTVIDESKFTMYQGASVRTTGTAEEPNATGLRFKTLASEFKEDLNAVYPTSAYNYQWYTELCMKKWEGETYPARIKKGDDYVTVDYKKYEAYEIQVNAKVWHEEGWDYRIDGDSRIDCRRAGNGDVGKYRHRRYGTIVCYRLG